MCLNRRVGLRLLLWMTLWPGPLPWGHSHAGIQDQLAEHLARFHPHDDHAAELGWHWHLSFPDWEHPGQDDRPQLPEGPVALLLEVRLVTSSPMSDPLLDCAAAVWGRSHEHQVALPTASQLACGPCVWRSGCSLQQFLCRLSC